jgi:hypothetical protein
MRLRSRCRSSGLALGGVIVREDQLCVIPETDGRVVLGPAASRASLSGHGYAVKVEAVVAAGVCAEPLAELSGDLADIVSAHFPLDGCTTVAGERSAVVGTVVN